MLKVESAREREATHFLPVVKRLPVVLVEGRGSRLRDAEGRTWT
jgi:acetylornithine/succinyldiaminopimelate/putrescine aminotransferase